MTRTLEVVRDVRERDVAVAQQKLAIARTACADARAAWERAEEALVSHDGTTRTLRADELRRDAQESRVHALGLRWQHAERRRARRERLVSASAHARAKLDELERHCEAMREGLATAHVEERLVERRMARSTEDDRQEAERRADNETDDVAQLEARRRSRPT